MTTCPAGRDPCTACAKAHSAARVSFLRDRFGSSTLPVSLLPDPQPGGPETVRSSKVAVILETGQMFRNRDRTALAMDCRLGRFARVHSSGRRLPSHTAYGFRPGRRTSTPHCAQVPRVSVQLTIPFYRSCLARPGSPRSHACTSDSVRVRILTRPAHACALQRPVTGLIPRVPGRLQTAG